MPEYQRLVSYIYLYDKGIKVKNSGFAKIECKDNILRIKMNLKGAFHNLYEQWKVYLLFEENREMVGIYVGDIKSKGTNAEFQMISAAEKIGGSTKSFDDLKGLAVISTNAKKYATFWKDTNITVENFRQYEGNTSSQQNDNLIKMNSAKDIELLKAMSISSKEEKNVEDKISESVVIIEKQKPQVEVIETSVEKEEIQKESESNFEEETIEQQISRYEENIQEKNLQKEEIQEVNLNENWNIFLTQFKRIYPFSDKDEIQCIRIELKDLKILPKSQWILSSNSFVLHGYYNYQYLVLGKVNDQFILGIPGVYCNKEKLVAGLFGFNDFKPAQVSEHKMGRFGYWYRYL